MLTASLKRGKGYTYRGATYTTIRTRSQEKEAIPTHSIKQKKNQSNQAHINRCSFIHPLRSKMYRIPHSFETSNQAVRKLRGLIKRFVHRWPLHSHPAINVDFSGTSGVYQKAGQRKMNGRSDMQIIDSHLFKDRDEIAACLTHALSRPLSSVDVHMCLISSVIARFTRRGEEIYRIANAEHIKLSVQSYLLIVDILLQRKDFENASIVLTQVLTNHTNRTISSPEVNMQIADMISSFFVCITSPELDWSADDILNHFHTLFMAYRASALPDMSTISFCPFRSSHFDLLCYSDVVCQHLLLNPHQAHSVLQCLKLTITSNRVLDHSFPSYHVYSILMQALMNGRAYHWINKLYDLGLMDAPFSPLAGGPKNLLIAFATVDDHHRFRSVVNEWLASAFVSSVGDIDTSQLTTVAFLKVVFECINVSQAKFAESLRTLVQSLADTIVNQHDAVDPVTMQSSVFVDEHQELVAAMLVSLFRCGCRDLSVKLAQRFASSLSIPFEDFFCRSTLFSLNLTFHLLIAQTSSQLEPVLDMLSSHSSIFIERPNVLHQLVLALIQHDISGASVIQTTSTETLVIRFVDYAMSRRELFVTLKPSTLFALYSHLRQQENESDSSTTIQQPVSRSQMLLRSIVAHSLFLVKHSQQANHFVVSTHVSRSEDVVALLDILLVLASKLYRRHLIRSVNQPWNIRGGNVLVEWMDSVRHRFTNLSLPSNHPLMECLFSNLPASSPLHEAYNQNVVPTKFNEPIVVIDLPSYDVTRDIVLLELARRGQTWLLDNDAQLMRLSFNSIECYLQQQEWMRLNENKVDETNRDGVTFTEKLWQRAEIRKHAKHARDLPPTSLTVRHIKHNKRSSNVHRSPFVRKHVA